MTLNSVDFPAPLGPITARISPGATRIVTPSRAASAPKWRLRPSHSRYGAAATHHPPQALRRAEHDGDEDEAEDQRQRIREHAEVVLEREKERGAEDGSAQRAGAADDDHDEH